MIRFSYPSEPKRKTPLYVEIDGLRLSALFDSETFRDAVKYKPGKDRVVVATYPKCGTTWTLQIVSLILRKGVPPADAAEYFYLQSFMELTPLNFLQNLPKEACIKTHLPFDRITFSSEAKYICVARHPADCLVSFYHHSRFFPGYFFSDGTFDDFFELFIRGGCDHGDYFDHLLSWYERRHEPNVFFTTYESLKADPKGMILKIAKFMGDEFYEDLIRDDEEILKKVLEYSSMDFMKTTVEKYWNSFATGFSKEEQEANSVLKRITECTAILYKEGRFPVGNFIRNGAVGEGKIILSEEQKMRLKSRIWEKCENSDVMDLWKNN